MPTRALLVPGTPTPERRVPAHIPRPEYVGKAGPAPNTWPDVQPPEVIEAMRLAGRIAAQALAAGGAAVAPGVTTDAIDRVVHEFLVDHDAYPSTLGYKGFPKSCCTSLNEVICHGIPDTTVIQDGDIVNIDVTAFIGGVHGDTNATFLAGDVDEESRLLVERTREATMRAIKAVRPGRELSIVGRVIESYAIMFPSRNARVPARSAGTSRCRDPPPGWFPTRASSAMNSESGHQLPGCSVALSNQSCASTEPSFFQ